MSKQTTKQHLMRFLTDGGSKSTKPKESMEELIDELDLFKSMRPFLRQVKKEADDVVITGRTVDLMKKMADYGSLVLLALMHTTTNEKLKFEIVREVMNRVYGRPTEKHVNIKVPLDQMDEAQLDSIIRSEMQENKELLKEIIDVTIKKDK